MATFCQLIHGIGDISAAKSGGNATLGTKPVVRINPLWTVRGTDDFRVVVGGEDAAAPRSSRLILEFSTESGLP